MNYFFLYLILCICSNFFSKEEIIYSKNSISGNCLEKVYVNPNNNSLTNVAQYEEGSNKKNNTQINNTNLINFTNAINYFDYFFNLSSTKKKCYSTYFNGINAQQCKKMAEDQEIGYDLCYISIKYDNSSYNYCGKLKNYDDKISDLAKEMEDNIKLDENEEKKKNKKVRIDCFGKRIDFILLSFLIILFLYI